MVATNLRTAWKVVRTESHGVTAHMASPLAWRHHSQQGQIAAAFDTQDIRVRRAWRWGKPPEEVVTVDPHRDPAEGSGEKVAGPGGKAQVGRWQGQRCITAITTATRTIATTSGLGFGLVAHGSAAP